MNLKLLSQSDWASALRGIRTQLEPQMNEPQSREDFVTPRTRGLAKFLGRGQGAKWKGL